jgi:hypothetical protein
LRLFLFSGEPAIKEGGAAIKEEEGAKPPPATATGEEKEEEIEEEVLAWPSLSDDLLDVGYSFHLIHYR